MFQDKDMKKKYQPYQPKESQFNPSQLETSKVQLWSDSGTMRGLIPNETAKQYVQNGKNGGKV